MAMFSTLSDRLQGIFDGLRSKGRLSEADIDSAMRQIRLALLEADVNFKVVKGFVDSCRERCLTAEVMGSLTPAQNVVKVVLDELTVLLGTGEPKLELSSRIPSVIMLVGLQGSGKTTAAAKLAYRLKKEGHNPLLVACDVYRPAAVEQLQSLGDDLDVRVYRGEGGDPIEIAKASLREAVDTLRDVVIIDTAGRLHIDERMMAEAAAIKEVTTPDQVLMVVDAMTGQDAVNAAAAFAETVDFDGIIMSKMDGDARGGAALSIREVTGKPIKFISQGEKPESLEAFHPDRMAKRILGMGDMVSLIEKAVAVQEEKVSEDQARRMAKAQFTFDDFLDSMKQVRKMGGLGSVLSQMPGGDKALASGKVDEHEIDRIEAIIRSMTAEERAKPTIINGSRRARIAQGAGVEVYAVNQLIKRFDETRKMMRRMSTQMAQGKGRKGRRGRGGMMNMPGMGNIDLSKFDGLR